VISKKDSKKEEIKKPAIENVKKNKKDEKPLVGSKRPADTKKEVLKKKSPETKKKRKSWGVEILNNY